jgi:hypothetical protein
MPDQTLPTAEEVASALSAPPDDPLQNLTPEEATVAAKLLPALADKANKAAEAKKAKELEELIKTLSAENIKLRDIELEKLRAANKPPNPQELEKLLSQEYLEFTLRIPTEDGVSDFVIRELPQAAETRLFNTIKKKLVPALSALSSIEWNSSMTTASKLEKVIDATPLALDTMSELVSVCLNPFGKSSTINAVWVQNNLSSVRQLSVLEAQVAANRFRDFFSALSRFTPGLMT